MIWSLFYSGNVSTDSTYGDFLGAESVSSDVAEVHALAWAMMFCLQHAFRDVELCFDSTYAHGMATSVYIPRVHDALITILAGLKGRKGRTSSRRQE